MKTYSLTAMRSLDEQYFQLASEISEKYKCQWDDSIHDSYLTFVKQIKELQYWLHDVRNAIDAIEAVSDGLDVDELEAKAQSLRWEAEIV